MKHAHGLLAVIASLVVSAAASAQPVVNVGQGSYYNGIPGGAQSVTDNNGTHITPTVTPDFDQPAASNEFWSSLMYQRSPGNHFGNNMYAHPLNMHAQADGLMIGYDTSANVWNAGYNYEFGGSNSNMVLGVVGLSASQVRVASYGDWSVTAEWSDSNQSLHATFAHGLPYVYCTTTGGNAQVKFDASAGSISVWSDLGRTLGVTVEGKHYGLFAPTGSDWTISGTTATATLPSSGYYSVALLPDTSAATLSLFAAHAFVFVTDTRVSYAYDAPNGEVVTQFTFDVDVKEGAETEPITALYRHQWIYADPFFPVATYTSPRGEMRALVGADFITRTPFRGVLPTLADTGAVDPLTMATRLNADLSGGLPGLGGDTYFDGKALERAANMLLLAKQSGNTSRVTTLLNYIRTELSDWLKVSGSDYYFRDPDWDTLIGWPSGFGLGPELNDHHFHYGYAVYTAAVIAMFDPDWAQQSGYGGMIDLLIKDAANWDRTDTSFPVLRNFDPYAGHSWASGHANFDAGNNQESSSEAMNFATACVLWGLATHDDTIRDLGIYLHATEAAAIGQYWFDEDNAVFPAMQTPLAGIVWSNGIAYGTWWTGNPEEIHGINFLPVNGGSLYLGQDQQAMLDNYSLLKQQNPGDAVEWAGVIWSALALADPAQAKSLADSHSGFDNDGGDSRTRTLHWIDTLADVGAFDSSVHGDYPASAAFFDGVNHHYMAWNAGDTELTVSFSDGFTMCVQPGELLYRGQVEGPTSCAVAPCPPDLNGDGVVDNGDIGVFITLFLAGDPSADFNADGILDNGDIGGFIAAFLAGC